MLSNNVNFETITDLCFEMASKQPQIKLPVGVGCISHNNQMTTFLMFKPTMGEGPMKVQLLLHQFYSYDRHNLMLDNPNDRDVA